MSRALGAVRSIIAVLLAAAVFCVPLAYSSMTPVTAAVLEPLGTVPDVSGVAWPTSAGAQQGVDYPYFLHDCVSTWPVDFDQSFWALDPYVDSVLRSRAAGGSQFGQQGWLRLVGPNQAVFWSTDGAWLALRRQAGPMFWAWC